MGRAEDISDFRDAKQPFITIWSTGDVEAYGSLQWISGSPVLTIFIESSEDVLDSRQDPDLPFFAVTKPPIQANITGRVPKFGYITLENCVRYNVRSSHDFKSRKIRYQLDLMPNSIWIGVPKSEVNGRVTCVVASDTRVSGFFGNLGLETHQPFYSNAKEVFEHLGNPKVVWAVHGPDQHQIELGNTGWFLSVYANVLQSSSATKGYSLKSTTNIALHSPRPVDISEATKKLADIEGLISTLSIEPFKFEFEWYETDGIDSSSLVWRLGEERSLFRSPMRHQVLIDLSNPDILRRACKEWFCASSKVDLSRWLFVRALRETDDGLARFVAVAQAFEALGRNLDTEKDERITKKRQVTLAVEKIQEALSSEFDREFIDRIIGLVQSSNKRSFRDILNIIIGRAAAKLGHSDQKEVNRFCKSIS